MVVVMVTDHDVVDIDLEGAQEFVKSLKDPRASAVRVDVTDKEQLTGAIRGKELVLNTTGPFHRYAVPIIRAAIESEVNYMDICDDVEPTIEILKLDQEARDAGIFALLGMGASPGLTNLLAKELSSQLDEVEEIITAWVIEDEVKEEKVKGFSKGFAVLNHMFHISTDEAVTFRDGEHIKISAFEDGFDIPFPKPLGPYTCYHVAHPEVVTLPDQIEGVRTVSNLGSLYPPLHNEMVRTFKEEVETGKRSVQSAIEKLRKMSDMEWGYRKETGEVEPRLGGMYVAAIGEKDGERGQQYMSFTSKLPMDVDTGQPLACATLQYALGKVGRARCPSAGGSLGTRRYNGNSNPIRVSVPRRERDGERMEQRSRFSLLGIFLSGPSLSSRTPTPQ